MRTSLAATLATVLAFGCTDQPLPTASSDSPVVGAGFSASRKGGAVVTQTADIVDLGPGIITSGRATLTRNAKGLWLTGQSDGLVEGDAYTVWAAIFDNANGCGGGPGGCGGGDFGVRQAQATISNFGGFVVDADKDFEIHLSRHDASRQTLGGLGRSGINNTYRAEVHFIFRSHGLAETDPGDLADQTSMVAAFCNLPVVGCDDQGLAIFLPPGPPGQG